MTPYPMGSTLRLKLLDTSVRSLGKNNQRGGGVNSQAIVENVESVDPDEKQVVQENKN